MVCKGGGGDREGEAAHNRQHTTTHIPLSPCLSVRCVSGGGSMKNLHIAVQNRGKTRNMNCEGRGAKMAPQAEEERGCYTDLLIPHCRTLESWPCGWGRESADRHSS
jgi:hypothetical protein